jgi:hypothetical protein
MSDGGLDELLCLSRPQDLAAMIEQNYERMPVAAGAIALHLLARSTASMPTEQRKQIAQAPWFEKMMMRLGSQLSGGSETDAQGLSSILWAMAQLEQNDSPLLMGLIKRLLLLAQHGRVSPAHLLLTTQALTRLRLLSGAAGVAISNILQARLGEFHAAQLGTIARCFTDAPCAGTEPILRAILASRLGEFSAESVASRVQTLGLGGEEDTLRQCESILAHGSASLLFALAAANLNPPPPETAVEILLNAFFEPLGTDPDLESLALPRLAELLWTVMTIKPVFPMFDLAEVVEMCQKALRTRLTQLTPNELPTVVKRFEELGVAGRPALTFARDRQAMMSEQISAELAAARDESQLLELLRSRPINGSQLCSGLGLLSRMVQRCPDPHAWATSLTARPDFPIILEKLRDQLPNLDSGFMCDALRALAELRVKNPMVLTAFCEQLDRSLHTFTAVDTAWCIWAFCTLGLAQAPAYPRMMRSIDKQLHTLPASLIAQLIVAIVPLGRAAACSRLLPRLVSALAGAKPPLLFPELLVAARQLCRRVPLTEPLLIQLQQTIAHETSSEGEGALAGNLSPEQVATSLWLFVRHLPLLQQQSPHSPLLPLVPQLIEQLLHLLADLDSLPAEHLCDMVNVLARLQRPNTTMLARLLAKIEGRLAHSQLRLAQVVETAWSLFELHGQLATQSELTEKLLTEIESRAKAEGADSLCDALRLLGSLPMRRPWPLVEPIAAGLRRLEALEPQLLSEVIDGLARLRYDDPRMLDWVESQVERSLERKVLHEAQAAAMVEAFGTLGHVGRTGHLVLRLLERVAAAASLLPHSAVALLHGLALLRTSPAGEPLPTVKITAQLKESGLVPELADVGILLWSYVELDQAQAALELLQGLPADLVEAAAVADLHTLTLTLWALLVLRQYDHPLLPAVLRALTSAAAGIRQPPQLMRLAECMLMLQLEAPQDRGFSIPQDLCMRAQGAWERLFALQLRERPSQQLREVSAALDGLGMKHQVRVFNTYLIDALISHEVGNGTTYAILLHPPSDYISTPDGTRTESLLGSLQLKRRLLQALGCVVVHVPHETWNDQRMDQQRQSFLRDLLGQHKK